MNEYKKTGYPGIYKRKIKTKDNFYVRFKFRGKIINYKNLTKKFGITEVRKASSFLDETIMPALKKGIDPFSKFFDPNPEENKGRTIKQMWENYQKVNFQKISASTTKNYVRFYNNFLKDKFEHKCITQITKDELIDVLYVDLKGFSHSYKSRFKIIMGYFYTIAEQERIIDNNFMRHLEFDLGKATTNKIPIEFRTDQKFLTMAQYIYDSAYKYETQAKLKEELPLFLLLNLMSGHRYGELCELRTSNLDLKNKRLIAFKDITKTQIISAFPYPEELDEYFNQFKGVNDDRKLFPSIVHGSYGRIFERIIRDINKCHKLDDGEQFKITAHEMRNLLLSTMAGLGHDSDYVDKACLDHNANTIKATYLSAHYNKKVELYNIYWNEIRKHSIPDIELKREKRKWKWKKNQ